MDHQKIKAVIEAAIIKRPTDLIGYEDLFSLCREHQAEDFAAAHEWNHDLRGMVGRALRSLVEAGDFRAAEQFNGLLFRSLL